MKLTNTSIETLAPGGAGAIGGPGGKNSSIAAAGAGNSDSVKLSSASQLVNLAKASAAPDRASKLSSIAALVRSGQYSSDTTSVSHALVDGHIQ